MKYLHLLLINLMFFGTVFGNSGTDSLKKSLETATPRDSLRIYYKLGVLYEDIDNTDGYDISSFGLELARKYKDPLYEIDMLNMKGRFSVNLAFTDIAYECFMLSIDRSNEIDDGLRLAIGYNNLGVLFEKTGAYQKAIDYALRAEDILEEYNDPEATVNNLIVLGSLYNKIGEPGQALNYLNQAREVLIHHLNQRQSTLVELGLGNVYLKEEEYGKAKESFDKVLSESDQYGFQYLSGAARLGLGELYILRENFDEAEKNLKLSGEIFQSLKLPSKILETNLVFAQLFKTKKQYREAFDAYFKCMELANKISTPVLKEIVYKDLSDIYLELGDYENAFIYQNRYVSLRDSLYDAEKAREIKVREAKRLIDKKDDQVINLSKRAQMQDVQIKKRNILVYSVSAGFLVIGLFSLLLFNGYRLKKKSNEMLEIKNTLINSQNEDLTQKNELINIQNEDLKAKNDLIHHQNEDLKSINQELQTFAYVASHDLKEPLRNIKSYLKLLSEREPNLKDDSREFLGYAVDASVRMDNLLSDLLTYSRISRSKLRFDDVDLGKVVAMAINNLNSLIQEKEAEIIVGEMPVIKAQGTQMLQLFQNLIGNAVKFTRDKKPLVEIKAERNVNNVVIFSVKDNGIGIAEDAKNRIFMVFQRLHRQEEFEGTGIGLSICKKVVEIHRGRIWIESEPGEGTTFFFSIPQDAA